VSRFPFAGRHTLPFAEGAEKRIGIFVAEEAGGFAEFERRLQQVLLGRFAPCFADELAEAGAILCDPPL
jgi:hypothetical protein